MVRPVDVRMLRNRLAKRRIWKRIFLERLSEPVHLNLMAAGMALFGSERSKFDWDLVIRPYYAYGILTAADLARAAGATHVNVVEFGVASGTGLMNMAAIASRVEKMTAVEVKVHGFDSGAGMPPARDYRDHPELYQAGDFAMNEAALRAILPTCAQLHIGELTDTVPRLVEQLGPDSPLGFVAFDLDYYWSTVEALALLDAAPDKYLPWFPVYLDDIMIHSHNTRAGELLAVAEFNEQHPLRLIERHEGLEVGRVFRRAPWLRQIYFVHVLDHPLRNDIRATEVKRYIENPYLPVTDQPSEQFSNR